VVITASVTARPPYAHFTTARAVAQKSLPSSSILALILKILQQFANRDDDLPSALRSNQHFLHRSLLVTEIELPLEEELQMCQDPNYYPSRVPTWTPQLQQSSTLFVFMAILVIFSPLSQGRCRKT